MRKTMKVILLTLTFYCLSATVLSQSITLNLSSITVKQAIQTLKEKTGYSFVYEVNDIDTQRIISVKTTNKSIEDVVKQVLSGQNVEFEIINKNVVIAKKAEQHQNKSETKQQSQSKKITGLVTDEKGDPIIGASLMIKGTKMGTITDIDGKFSLEVPEQSQITISYIGFKQTILKLNTANNYKINLEEDSKTLDEVVVIGYGSMQKKDLTGAITSIKSADIVQNKTVSFVDAMQGKLAGVHIAAQSGEIGSSSRISIRGSNSLYGSSLPLYIIDGVQIDVNTGEVASAKMGNGTTLDPMSSINPSDIESIDVLKDASATAIYGSRGANGVVIITTKSGKAGKTKFSYDSFLSLAKSTKKMDVLNGSEFIDYRKTVEPNSLLFYTDSNQDGSFNSLDIPKDPYSNPYHNWQDEMLRTAVAHSHNITVDGGSNDTQFSSSISYLDNEGIIINNDYERITGRIKLDTKRNKLKMGVNLNTSYSEFNGASQSGGEGGTFNGIVQQLVTARPVEIYIPSWDNTGSYVSPISMLESAYKSTTLMRTNINTYFDYSITKELSLNISVGGMLSSSKGKEFYGKNTEWGAGGNGFAQISENRAYYISNSNQLIYKKDFTNNQTINAVLVYEINKYNYEAFGVSNSSYLDESTGVNSISKGSILSGLYSYRDVNHRMSFLSRVFYDINKKYLITASIRADGSDKFGSSNKFGYFPSLAFAWRMSEENFMKNQKVFENLKFRLSYGMTGNERIPSHQYMAMMENAYYNGTLGLAPASMKNNNLKWESTAQYNVGIDFGILNGRVQISTDYYQKYTSNMLMPAEMPGQSGFLKQWQNKGKVLNQGIELQISTKNINNKNFQWTTDFNISTNKNTVLDLGGVDYMPVSIGGGWITNVGRVIVGESIGTAYGYVFNGVYQIDDFTWQENNNPTIPHESRIYNLKSDVVSVKGIKVKPGSFKFANIDGSVDNVVDENDKTIISHSSPKFFGGISNSFKIRDFDLTVFLSGSYGNQIFNESRFRLEGGQPATWLNIARDFYLNRWTPDNPTNKYGTFSLDTQNFTSTQTSSYYVEDASFLRLTNISFGYNVDLSSLKKVGVKNLNKIKVYITGNNLYTWTKYTGFDPEVDSNNALLTGFDRVSYPHSKSVLFGVNISF